MHTNLMNSEKLHYLSIDPDTRWIPELIDESVEIKRDEGKTLGENILNNHMDILSQIFERALYISDLLPKNIETNDNTLSEIRSSLDEILNLADDHLTTTIEHFEGYDQLESLDVD